MLELIFHGLKTTPFKMLAAPVCEDAPLLEGKTLSAQIEKAMKLDEFRGKKDQSVLLYAPRGLAAERFLVEGMGKRADLTADALRSFSGNAVKKCIKMGLTDLTIVVPSEKKCGLPAGVLVKALMEGAYLANHIFDRYKEEKKQIPLARIGFAANRTLSEQFKELPGRVEIICAGTVAAREWVSLPPNDKQPAHYAGMIADAATSAGLGVTVLDEAALKEKKFGALLAVAQGSAAAPRLVVLEHRPENARQSVALVGKGVTFDAGGINLKVGGFIEEMKMDMAGSAAVAATVIAAARLNLPIRVTGLLPLVENMPSGTAVRPGDIVTSYAGKTVEIGNTDAEGRLILADTIAYAADTCRPEILIDVATLTGACIVALGEKIAGVFSPDDALREELISAGRAVHERIWPLPLPEDYKEYLKSEFADINNMSSSRGGGAITAALFLQTFVKDVRWAHIDIAGPAYNKKESAYGPPGGTGFGVRLLTEFLEKRCGNP